MKWEKKSWFFTLAADPKLACAHCGKAELAENFVRKLNVFRFLVDEPVFVTSGYRCPDFQKMLYDEALANDDPDPPPLTSAHTKGLGVDVWCPDSGMRRKMLIAAEAAGFKRVGIYNNHLHLDDDPDKPSEVYWVGTSK